MLLRFLTYGVFGWCTEIVWTAFTDAVEARWAGQPINWRLIGTTYLWMFPIYAGGGLAFEVAHAQLTQMPWVARGLVYMIGCFAVEYVSGWILLQTTGSVPWDYSQRRWQVHGLIRLDYAPAWFVFGLLLERVERAARTIERAFS